MNTEKTIGNILLAMAASALIAGCSKNNAADASMANAAKAPPPVEVAYPVKKELQLWDKYTARIDSEYSVDIQARVGGYLQSVNFKDGDFVKKGDLLFVIDPRPYEAVEAAACALIKQAEARKALAESNAARAKQLYDSKAISKEEMETRQSEVLTSDASLMSAKANLREAQLNLEFTRITAPISGHMSRRFVDAGNLIPNGQSPVLASIVSREKVYAYFEVSERDVIRYMMDGLKGVITGEAKNGPAVTMTLADGGKEYKGIVTYVDPRIDKDSSTLTMRAEIDNADGQLLPGMFGTLMLQAASPKNYLLVPEAVINTDLRDRYVVLVDKEGNVKYSTVKVGRLIGGKMRIIESGVKEDDLVLIKGAFRAMPGAKVTPQIIELEK